MDSCTLLTLVYALGTGILTGLIGWFLGKKSSATFADQLKNKEYELSNLRTSMDKTLSKTNESLAVANREKRETEDILSLWKEKFAKLQMQIAESKTQETQPILPESPAPNKAKGAPQATKEPVTSHIAISALKEENVILKEQNKELELKLKKASSVRKTQSTQAKKTITTDLTKKVHDQYKSEIKKLKSKLKKTKEKLSTTEKALRTKPKEIEITKSIDIETLKKMLDRAPLKKVSERVISRRKRKG